MAFSCPVSGCSSDVIPHARHREVCGHTLACGVQVPERVLRFGVTQRGSHPPPAHGFGVDVRNTKSEGVTDGDERGAVRGAARRHAGPSGLWRLSRKAHTMHCSTSPSHSTASGWTASAGSKAIITHGPSGGSRKSPGSHPSMSHGAAAAVSRHARRWPAPPPSATASTAMGTSSGATMRACRTRGPCGCASTSNRHGSSGPRNGTGVANAPAAAISRPYARVTSSAIPERSDWR